VFITAAASLLDSSGYELPNEIYLRGPLDLPALKSMRGEK